MKQKSFPAILAIGFVFALFSLVSACNPGSTTMGTSSSTAADSTHDTSGTGGGGPHLLVKDSTVKSSVTDTTKK